ncbi:malto-oligosyltrehalose trehalohydrolase [Paraherbaspirillum soli]|uniref:Malto-oligosyltrehalose trehalohydrolase n=1 Tax=Paraherbaspirillum soli TaxID=631222 RepID=A0ABW0MF86_9BURK
MTAHYAYRLPFGATCIGPDRTRFRLWAPSASAVAVELEDQEPLPMTPEAAHPGWFEAELMCAAGSAYRYRLQSDRDGELLVPDPASRAQRGDIHDASLVVEPNRYQWLHPEWQGRPWHETVLYELHVGALGGFAAVAQRLPRLARLGITAIELMPVAEFPGPRNWGYDGVLPFAPDAAYGTPEQLKALIDSAHGLGLMVLLDVVYNHFGPDGNYLGSYAAPFFRNDQSTRWGRAIDFRVHEVREFFIENALYWLQEYRFDGLRLAAADAIGEQDWLPELALRLRAAVAAEQPQRQIHLILEHEGNAAHLLTAGAFDAQWNDDGHHVLHVLLTGEQHAYYVDYAEQPAQKLARCLAEGFAYQGEASAFRQGQARGEPSAGLAPTAFVLFLQNHDQIGNRAFGERLTMLADPRALHAAQALLLLSPQIPLLFMGEEVDASQPFLYFTSHADAALAEAVRSGRRRQFADFPGFADAARLTLIPDPNAAATFARSIPAAPTAAAAGAAPLDEMLAELLAIRHAHIIPRLQHAHALDAQAIGPAAVAARWRMGDDTELLLMLNLGLQPVAIALDALLRLAEADVLFASPGAVDTLAHGKLAAYSMLALLEPAP